MSELVEGLTWVLVGIFIVVLADSFRSTKWLHDLYGRMREPRPRFFRMLVNSSWTKVICGAYLGYVTTGRFLDRVEAPIRIPVPPIELTQALAIVVAIVLFAPPIYYRRVISRVGQEERDLQAIESELVERVTEATSSQPPQTGGHS